MITATTIHALDRLVERRGCKHLIGHLKKRRNLPANGITEIKGYLYITRDGVLITVIPANKRYMKNLRKKGLIMQEREQ